MGSVDLAHGAPPLAACSPGPGAGAASQRAWPVSAPGHVPGLRDRRSLGGASKPVPVLKNIGSKGGIRAEPVIYFEMEHNLGAPGNRRKESEMVTLSSSEETGPPGY
jgi:hypothetical protein